MPGWTEEQLSDRLDQAIADVLRDAEFDFGVPVHWVVIVGHQRADGESAVSFLPRHGQPSYVSLGLIQRQAAKLTGR